MIELPFPVTREFHDAVSIDSPLHKKCLEDADEFWNLCKKHNTNFREEKRDLLPGGFNIEKLKSGKQSNLWSIRVAKNPRIIIAEDGNCWIFANAGKHDEMYDWAAKKKYYVGRKEIYRNIPKTVLNSDLKKALKSKFEEWMLWLHPEQNKYVEMLCRGALRIRGAAGTGKSVIGLHRAAYLAEKYKNDNPNRILVTAFHKSAVKNLKELYFKMPNCLKNVDFKTINQIAQDEFDGVSVDQRSEILFDKSWEKLAKGSNIENYGKDYIKEEIERVIHGREFTNEYLDTDRFERVGRKIPLKRKEREIVWQLYEDWEERMNEEGVFSFAKVLRHVMQKREGSPVLPRYRAVIVDEAQDMTYVAMRFARTLVAGRRENPIPENGLFLLEDLAQQIYAGGFRYSWPELGLDSNNLETTIPLPGNYRNSSSIFNAAKEVRGKSLLVTEKSHNSEDEKASFPECVREEGEKPHFCIVEKDGECPEILKRVKELKKKELKEEEIGILCRVNSDAREVQEYLEEMGVKCQDLRKEEGKQEGGCVGITTFDSAKGLEFRAVIIPRIGKSNFPLLNKGEEIEKEELLLERDRLYVAMTRPTERLYLIADEEPWEEIMKAQDKFDGNLWQPPV
ncbi:3'-5' exonuclease [Candidatus Mycalebacterium sp.]